MIQLDTIDSTTAMAFPSELGWMAAVWSDAKLASLSFGYRSRAAALHSVGVSTCAAAAPSGKMEDLVERLQQFAGGEPDDFLDIELDWSGRTPFQRAVLQQCRQIPYGAVMTYGQLAAKAGYPGSARAVGNVMASNRVPLIIPCHRVVAAGGALGGFSAPDGLRMKRRLLKLEGVSDL
jgi:methylated-DNA-[protein]-cysteine S-methyltransferase